MTLDWFYCECYADFFSISPKKKNKKKTKNKKQKQKKQKTKKTKKQKQNDPKFTSVWFEHFKLKSELLQN